MIMSREDERPEPVAQAAGLLGVFKRRDQVGKRGVVDAATAFRCGDGETDGEVGLPHARRTHDVMLTF
ncbi:MAG TPA: hypothetical protein VM716_02240 [Gemmatimonadales bacterium]|nr:hypothetical protein [Gemmatimonadales bacterium]